MSKRAFDLLVATAALLLLAPLLLLIALAVKLDSPGPVFFRQERVGRHGRPFHIFKFRTMSALQAPGSARITVGADPRITRVGRLLRRSKFDELAQLIDVLRGTMSLVGPRPELPHYVALYPATLRDKVLSVRPGITDPASIEYRDESKRLAAAADPEREYVQTVMPAKLRNSAAYIDRMSFATDLRVLAATVKLLWQR